MRKIAIVGSKSLDGYDSVYETIQEVAEDEISSRGPFILINGGEEGVDTMAGEVALSLGLDYDIVPLQECSNGCVPGKEYCFEHSYRPRSKEIAMQAEKIYRIYDEGCGTSTCEVTARFGEELGKQVRRISIDLLTIAR